jgi:hypothetical protein
MSDEESEFVRSKVNQLVDTKMEVRNPFAPYFADIVGKLAPDQKTRSLMNHFWNVIEGVTKINYFDTPIAVDYNAKTNTIVALVNIQDMYMAMDIYLKNFVRDIHGIPPMGDIILQGFKDCAKAGQEAVGNKKSSPNLSAYSDTITSSASYSINEVRSAIKKHQNITLKTKVVKDMCNELVDAGYLEDDRSEKVIRYSTTDPFTQIPYPNAQKMFDDALEKVREKYPKHAEKWAEKQLRPYLHPITGEKVDLGIKYERRYELPDIGEDLN